MTPRLRPVHLALLLALGCASAQAGDLLQAYDLARQGDPQLAGSEANKRAQEEGVVQSRSLLLPQIGATASLSRSNLNESSVSAEPNATGTLTFGPDSGTADVTTRDYAINAQQSIYDHSIYTRLKASHSRADQADALYDNAAQTLVTRVAQAYFNVLSAIQDLASSRAEDRALKRQLDQANVRLQVGLAPITDAQEAQGSVRHLACRHNRIRDHIVRRARSLDRDHRPANRALQGSRARFQADRTIARGGGCVGQDGSRPESADPRAAAGSGRGQSRRRNRARGSLADSRGNCWLQRCPINGGSNAFNGFDFPATGLSKGPTYAVTLSVPIFSGFAVSSKVRQALALRDAAADTLEQTRRSIERQARNSFHATVAGLSQIEAQKQALLAAQTSLEATETGLEVGTRTIVDVLINEQQLFSTQRDYARARNNFIVNELLLKQAAGNLQGSDVAAVNTLLVSDAEAALDQPADAGDTAMPGLPTGPAAADTGAGKPDASAKTDNAANTGTDTLVKHKKKKKHPAQDLPSTDAPPASPPR